MRCMQSISSGAEHVRQILALLHADAVLAGDRAAHLDAHAQDSAGERLGALQRARLAAIVKDERMQVAVARMKHVGAADARLARPSRRCAAAPRRVGAAAPRRPAR